MSGIRRYRPSELPGQVPAARLVLPGDKVKPPRAAPVQHEFYEQCLFFKRVRLDPRTRDLLIYAIPNGGFLGTGGLDKRRMARAVASGLTAGVPDIAVDEQRFSIGQMCPGLRIELKRDDPNKNGTQRHKPSADQAAWLAKLTDRGYRTAVCYSATDAWAVLCDYLGISPD